MTTLAHTSVAPDMITPELALEVAQNLRGIPDILADYEISKDQFKIILKTPLFRNLYKEKRHEWNSPSSAKERIRARADMALESQQPVLHGMVMDTDLAPSHRLAAHDKMLKMSSVADKPALMEGGPTASTFTVTINMSAPDGTTEKTVIGERVNEE